MKLKLILALVTFIHFTKPSGAEDWTQLNRCVDRHSPSVEQVEPSLHDGARLIVDILCVDAAADLGNQMIRNPERNGVIKDHGFSGAFDAFKGVIRREVTVKLFEARKRRMGL